MSEIHKNVNLVIGIKNIFELEDIINSRESCFSFLNRPIIFFSKRTGLTETKMSMIY